MYCYYLVFTLIRSLFNIIMYHYVPFKYRFMYNDYLTREYLVLYKYSHGTKNKIKNKIS